MPARLYTLYKPVRPANGGTRALLSVLLLAVLLGGWIALAPQAQTPQPPQAGLPFDHGTP